MLVAPEQQRLEADRSCHGSDAANRLRGVYCGTMVLHVPGPAGVFLPPGCGFIFDEEDHDEIQ